MKTFKNIKPKGWQALAFVSLMTVGSNAMATITMQGIDIPAIVGRGQTVTVPVRYQGAGGGPTDSISIPIPTNLQIGTPLTGGCTPSGTVGVNEVLDCTVATPGLGASSSTTVYLTGRSLGGANITATSGNTASQSYTVIEAGDLQVLKSVSSATVVNGQSFTFTLTPSVAVGGDAIPTGAVIRITDTLPGSTAQYALTAISATGYSCTSVATAQSTRSLVCDFTGNGSAVMGAITLTGRTTLAGTGNLTNNVNIATTDSKYIDLNINNNLASVGVLVSSGTDPEPLGAFTSPALISTAQAFTLTYRNNGPQTTVGAVVRVAIPAGFTIGTLTGCTNQGAGTVNSVAGTIIQCPSGTVASGATQVFSLPLTTPGVAASGNFGVDVVTSGSPPLLPDGAEDYNPGNNTKLVPYSVLVPASEMGLTKTKSIGPIAAGGAITNTIVVRNSGLGTAVYSAAGGGTPLRVVDTMSVYEEFDLAATNAANLGTPWTCSDSAADTPSAGLHRVVCELTTGGSLAQNATATLSLRTKVSLALPAGVGTPLSNTACTGGTALSNLGLLPANGPQPEDGTVSVGSDCVTQSVVGTPVIGVPMNIVKESSIDGTTWVDATTPTSGLPRVLSSAEILYWRLTVSNTSGTDTIPTLNLNDTVAGVLNASNPGSVPSAKSPATVVTTTVTAGSATGSCPNLGIGGSGLACSFTSVAPNTTIQVVIPVHRPLAIASVTPLTNTATLSSPDATLSGTLTDQAAAYVDGRSDWVMTAMTVNPLIPKVGQNITFTATASNFGPNVTTLPVTISSAVDPAKYELISASGTGMAACTVTVVTGVVSCTEAAADPGDAFITRTINIVARVLKPGSLPGSGNVYTAETVTASVAQNPADCEWRVETNTPTGAVSTACNDGIGKATSNNSKTATFDVTVPQIDLVQRKTQVYPGGQSSFGFGDVLSYRLRIQNAGLSRAEGVKIIDRLNLPVGVTVASMAVSSINGAAASPGYTLDASKNSSVSCTTVAGVALVPTPDTTAPGAAGDIECKLDSTPANSFLTNGNEVNILLSFTLNNVLTTKYTASNAAAACADESLNYETTGKCSFETSGVNAAGNNIASVSDVVYPKSDLALTKTRITASPIALGQPARYDIAIKNNGPQATTQIRVTDLLPPNFEWVTGSVRVDASTTTDTTPAAVASGAGAGTVTGVACTASPATLVTVGASQTVTCVLDGNFPGDVTPAYTLTLWAKPKPGLFTTPYLTDRQNTATVFPGKDGFNNDISIDTNAANNTATAQTQVATVTLAGLVFEDRDRTPGNGGIAQLAASEPRLAGVKVRLSGTDFLGNVIGGGTGYLEVLTAPDGTYSFTNLTPPDSTGYALTEIQPAAYVNGPIDPPTAGINAPTLANISGAAPIGAAGTYSRPDLAANTSYTGIKIALNQAGTNYNFPEVRRPSLSGRVYVDVNVNDSYTNGTDTNISAATVILRNAADLANSVATTTTLADGTYSFTNLDPLITYVLEEALPSTPAGLGNRATAVNVGTVNAVATGTAAANTPAANTDRITGIDLSSGVDGINYNFGEDLATTISGQVYNDRSRNGAKDGTEPGIEGVSLKLVAGTDCTAAAFAYTGLVNPVTTVITTGAYSFTPVPAGAQYTICETQPIGYADGPVGGVTTSITIASLLASGSTGNNFPEVLGNISGKVFADFGSGIAGNNNNGTQQASEPGIGSGTANLGVPVTLTGTPSAGPALPGAGVTLYTDASGNYSFIDLYAGNYTITQTAIPAALGVYNNGINTAGTVSNAGTPGTAGAVGINTISALVLAAGSQSPANNFAKMPVTAITGTVYIDLNRNNTKEATPTDGRIGSVTLNLYQASTCTGTPVATTTTGSDGAYIFSTVSAGLSYAICETQPLGYGDAAVNPGTDGSTTGSNVITIATLASTGSVGNDFGEIIGSLAGSVYRDFGGTGPAVSNNGLKETGELGIVNVPVTLSGTDAAGASVNLTATTDAAGAYDFSNLLAPNAAGYTIVEGVIPPASGSYSDGKDTAGNATVAAGNATAINDRISGIRIAGGENATGYNFGELEPPVIPTTFPDLVVTKTTGAARAFEGQLLNYTLRVKNAGPVVTEGIYTVTDTLPSGTGTPSKWTLESATGTGWNCSISSDKLSVSCSTATLLPPGQENQSAITLGVKVGTGAAAFSPLRNVVQVSGGGEPDDKKPQPGELSSPKACAANPEFNVCQLATPIDAATPDLVVTKAASKALFTEGGTVGYVLRVKNIGQSATVGQYTVTDTLPGTTGTPAKWALESAAGTGWTCTISADKLGVSCSHAAVLQPGEENASTIALAVKIGVGAAAFSPLINTVQVTGGGEPDDKKPQPGELSSPKACAANPEFNVCLLPTPVQAAAGLNGHVWIDGGLKKVLDSADKRLPQWIVEVYDVSSLPSGKTFTELVRGGGATRTTTTDAQGYYEVCGLEPNSIYRVLFRDPANRIAFPGVVTNEQGTATNADYWSQIKDREGFQVLEVKLPSSPGGSGCGGQGIAAPEQSLPLDPNGVVYDAKTRIPVPGAKVTLKPEGICTGYDPQLHIINNETYAHDAQGNPTMTTGSDGFYKFLLSGDPTAPQSCQFRLVVEQPVGYKTPPSTLITPNPLLQTPAAPGIYEVQPQKLAPTGNQSTTYHFLLMAGLAHREVFNNHIPLDPLIPGKLLLTKQGDKRLAEVGDTVLYTITVRLLEGDPVAQATVRDRLPAGFTLVRGTVRLNNLVASDPQGGLGPVLGFNLGALQPNVEAKLTYRVRVGVGSMQGDGINRAQAHACQVVAGCLDPVTLQALAGSVASNEAQHKVDVTGGVFTDNACLLGKVFVDCNNNHIQDAEELGIPGVRLYLENGQFMVTDSEGKYSRCGLTPRSHVLTADPSTLPRGSVLTTTSNRNLGDAQSLFIDLKNGELHRGDFAEGSCSNPVLEQVKARRGQGEVRSVETEKISGPALRFQSKPLNTPQQGTDSANQPLVQPRQGASDAR